MKGAKRQDLVESFTARLEGHVGEVDAEKVANMVVRAIGPVLAELVNKHEAVSLPGLGRFIKTKTKARKARNPRTNEAVMVPPGTKISFKASKKK